MHQAGDHVDLLDAARRGIFDAALLRIGVVRRGGRRRSAGGDCSAGASQADRNGQKLSVSVHAGSQVLVAVTTETLLGISMPTISAGAGGLLPLGGGAVGVTAEEPVPPLQALSIVVSTTEHIRLAGRVIDILRFSCAIDCEATRLRVSSL
jgi:hypothetical protein